MGRKGQNKKVNKKVSDENKNDLKTEDTAEDLFALFQPMAPNKRAELNGIVEQLLNKSSNFTQDDPTTPSKLYAEFEEIYAIVQKIRNIEMQANMNRRLRGPRKMHVKPFLEWLDKNGAKIEGVEIAEFGSQGLGLKVTKELKQGDVVISIPRKVFMSTETAKHSSLSELCEKDQMLQRMPNVSLALHLLVEKNSPASFWEPYINLLPSSYTTVLYFTPDDFKELRGSPALEDALKQFKYVARQYAYFYRKFQSMLLRDYFTFDEYRWAVSTVMTRQNQVPTSDLSQMTNTLIPFWDMSNHENGEMSTDFDDEKDCTLCMAQKDFQVGQQFTIFYGVRANIDLLVHNGFVFDTNVNDCLTLKLGISKNDPNAADKFKFLEELSINRTGLFFMSNLSEKPLDPTLLGFLRVLCLTKDNIEEMKDDLAVVKSFLCDLPDAPFAPELDRRVYQYLETRCQLLLKSYPTSLEEDLELLAKKEELSQKQYFCVLLRKQEKEMLNGAITYCKAKLN